MEKKMTKRDYFNEIIAIATEMKRQDLVDFANHEIELLDKKKSSGKGKANETMDRNLELVYNALAESGKSTVSELIAKADLSVLANELNIVSTQKISAYLNKLVASGRVEKVTEKKKTYFSVVETETDN
jgi:predicted transcriptional regulator